MYRVRDIDRVGVRFGEEHILLAVASQVTGGTPLLHQVSERGEVGRVGNRSGDGRQVPQPTFSDGDIEDDRARDRIADVAVASVFGGDDRQRLGRQVEFAEDT